MSPFDYKSAGSNQDRYVPISTVIEKSSGCIDLVKLNTNEKKDKDEYEWSTNSKAS